MSDEDAIEDLGPEGYANWRAFEVGEPEKAAAEFALYSDAHVIGQILEGLGPYKLINTIAIASSSPGQPKSAVILRAGDHLGGREEPPDLTQKRDAAWHGAGIDEKIAALVSLALGMRYRGGGRTRDFDPDGDPRGMPVEYPHYPPYLPPAVGKIQIPAAPGTHNLGGCVELISKYPKLEKRDAVVLLRAARAYQEGLWVAESDAQYAWLKLISAVEAAAGLWWTGKADAVALMRDWDAALVRRLEEAGGPELLREVSEKLVNITRATKKFLAFMATFMPDPPKERPREGLKVQWNDMPKLLNVVYKYRSENLHMARPFPGPLLSSPLYPYPNEPPEERPMGLASGVGGNVWMAEDLPIHLHLFEHVVRGALHNWWRQLRQT